MRKTLLGAIAVLATAACAPPTTLDTGAGPTMTPAQAPATAGMLPAGTVMEVRLTQPLGTAHSQVGDRFTATVDQAIVAQDGNVVIPQGAVVHGTVTGLAPATAAQPAAIRLEFERVTFAGHAHPFSAQVLETDLQLDDGDRASRALEGAAVGAMAGAMLGVIIRGDLAAAMTGAALGAGAGTIISLGTTTADANLPAGARMTIQSTQTVHLH